MPNIAGILALMVPIVALFIPIVAIIVSHNRKMVELRMQHELMMRGQGQLDTGAVPGLRDEFATLRESLTAHAMSLDENMKALGSRLTAIENKVNEKDPQSIRLGE